VTHGYNLVDGKFQHVILEGTSYEIGNMQGRVIKDNRKMYARIGKTISSFLASMGYSSSKPNHKYMGFQDFQEMQSFFEEHCPGLNEEVQGFADGLNIDVTEVPFYGATYIVPKNCSQFAVLSSVTSGGHVYVGRSYEWSYSADDLRLCTTRVKGKANHIGFSTFLFGRADGLNEHGVSATFTGGGIFDTPYTQKGFESSLAIRSILDSCKSVDDSVQLIQTMPLSGFFNLLVVDSKSNAALVEFADGTIDMKRIDNNSENKCLFSTNHYALPATVESNMLNCGIINNSRKRYQLLESALCDAAPRITKEALRTILSKSFPNGVCDHYYSEAFGTLWSAIFDLTSLKANICFGAPTHNKWRSFTLDEPVGVKEYPAIFPDARNQWPY
jgi:predicted choloylglycine hydrolase